LSVILRAEGLFFSGIKNGSGFLLTLTDKPKRRCRAMTKGDLVEKVAEAGQLSKRAAEFAVDTTFETIGRSIKKEKRFRVPGFGTFTVRGRKAREGRNPQTGAVIHIKASRTVAFKPAPSLKKGL